MTVCDCVTCAVWEGVRWEGGEEGDSGSVQGDTARCVGVWSGEGVTVVMSRQAEEGEEGVFVKSEGREPEDGWRAVTLVAQAETSDSTRETFGTQTGPELEG